MMCHVVDNEIRTNVADEIYRLDPLSRPEMD